MTSDRKTPDSVFVWIWLPGEIQPAVAGRITMDTDVRPGDPSRHIDRGRDRSP